MTTNLREFKKGDIIQSVSSKKTDMYIVGEIEDIEKLNLYTINGEWEDSVRVIKGEPLEMKRRLSGTEEKVSIDFQLIDKDIVIKYFLNKLESISSDCIDGFIKKLKELKGE